MALTMHDSRTLKLLMTHCSILQRQKKQISHHDKSRLLVLTDVWAMQVFRFGKTGIGNPIDTQPTTTKY